MRRKKSHYLVIIELCTLTALISVTGELAAQGFYNASSVHIQGADLHVDGEVSNSGTLYSSGVITFTTDWNNTGEYNGEGTVEARGNAPQKIANNAQNIFRLSINGWGTKYIKGSLFISGALHLLQGIVSVSPNDVLELAHDAVVEGGSSESFVDGAITTGGNGYKFFPIGKNGTYAPIEFLEVSGSTGKYSMEVFENAPAIAVDGVIVKNALYWQRQNLWGEFGSSAVAVNYEPSYFENPEAVILVGGSSWDEPFAAIRYVSRADETSKVTTQVQVSTPIIMLGETYEQWTAADFYLSTALSPHASQPENRKAMIFGDRLAGENFHFQVFNRWGDLVFETDSLDEMKSNGWDGRGRGTGAYPYRLTGVDKTGRPFERKGVITIVH